MDEKFNRSIVFELNLSSINSVDGKTAFMKKK